MYTELEKHPYATIYADLDKALIKVEWQGAATSVQYRELFTSALQYGMKNDAKLFISDIREQKTVSPDDRKWFQTVHMPKSIEMGLIAAAVVTDGGVFKRYYLNHIFNATKKFGLPLKFFADEDQALEWLIQLTE